MHAHSGANSRLARLQHRVSAANRGHQVVLASDCTGSMWGADQRWMALELMSRSIGWVLTADEIVDRLGLSGRNGPSRPTPPPEGTDVPLTTDETTRVIAAAQQRAADNGWRITVAIVDEGGLLKALSRMDGAPPLSAQIAEAKACGAALWHREGDGLVDVAKSRPAFFEGVDLGWSGCRSCRRSARC